VDLLLDGGFDINTPNSRGYTACVVASLAGHKEVVKLLLSRGAFLPTTAMNRSEP